VIHDIHLTKYVADVLNESSAILFLGTAGSHGVEQIRITADEYWDGLTIIATFHPPYIDPVDLLIKTDEIIDVPPEATAEPTDANNLGRIVFTGVADGKQVHTVNLFYSVADHASSDGMDSVPTPTIWEQWVNAFPTGGEAGQVLAKVSDEDRDVEWVDVSVTGGNYYTKEESAEIFQPAGDYILQTEVTSLSEDEIDAILDNLN